MPHVPIDHDPSAHPRPAPYLTCHRGTMIRDPGGDSVEDVAKMKAEAGIAWVACNVTDFPVSRWAMVKKRAADAGVVYMPKGRLGLSSSTRQQCLDRLDHIVRTAEAWAMEQDLDRLYAVVNAETELRDHVISAADIASRIAQYRQVAVSSEARLYWGVDWAPLHGNPILLQLYPEDAKVEPKDAEAVKAWCDDMVAKAATERTPETPWGAGYPARMVGRTYQGWRSDPDWFDRSGDGWNVAYADDVGGRWRQWA